MSIGSTGGWRPLSQLLGAAGLPVGGLFGAAVGKKIGDSIHAVADVALHPAVALRFGAVALEALYQGKTFDSVMAKHYRPTHVTEMMENWNSEAKDLQALVAGSKRAA